MPTMITVDHRVTPLFNRQSRQWPPQRIPVRHPQQLRRLVGALVAALPALLLVARGEASTTVPATTITAPTTWSLSGSPYIVESSVTVASGGTLTIEPGVQVRFAVGAWLDVADGGTLLAQGTSGQGTTFSSDAASPQAGDWYYLRALAGAKLRLAYCDIAYAGRNGYNAIPIAATDVQLDHCRIHDGTNHAVYIEGAGLAPVLQDVQIDGFPGTAILQSTVDMSPVYRNLVLTGNGTNSVVIPGGTVQRAVTIDGSTGAITTGSLVLNGVTTVALDGTLTLAPGSLVKLGTAAYVDVAAGGTLLAQGSATLPIVLRSAAATPQRGDWYYLTFWAGSHGRLPTASSATPGWPTAAR